MAWGEGSKFSDLGLKTGAFTAIWAKKGGEFGNFHDKSSGNTAQIKIKQEKKTDVNTSNNSMKNSLKESWCENLFKFFLWRY